MGRPLEKEKVRRPAMIFVREQTTYIMVMFYKLFLVSLCCLLIGIDLFSQVPVTQIPQAQVVETNKKYFSDDQTRRNLDLKSSAPDPSQNLGYILDKQSSAIIRSYGSTGALASISMHGTGSNHTQVNWNGFPLNSPTTGQVDLSLVPTGFVQSVEIINGASGALFGSNTFGGSINLNNEPDWNNIVSGNYVISAGSYGSMGHMLAVKTGSKRIQYQLCAIADKSENNFTYKDYHQYKAPEIENSHSVYRSFGLIQNVYLKLNRGNYLEAGLWYQQKSFEIPALMGSNKASNAHQEDSLLRSFFSYRKTSERSALVIKSAYFSDYLGYTDKFAHTDSAYYIDSRIASGRFMNEADFRYYLSQKVIFGGGISYNHMVGNSSNFGGKIREDEYTIYGNMRYVFRQVSVNLGLRKEFYEGLSPQPQHSMKNIG
jgi:vitamin B12 transporter